MNQLFIKVCGTCSSGKSTIAEEIRFFLKDKGFDVDLVDDQPIPAYNEDRVESLKKKNTKILVETVQVYTDILNEGQFKMPKEKIICSLK